MNMPTAKWVAEITRVRDVSLLGAADLTYWKERLEKEELLPLEKDGRAQIMIIAAEARFKGVSFKELSFSILISARDTKVKQNYAYLIQAFNSRRLFAFCERAFFATPYELGDVRVAASFPASIQLANAGDLLFQAEMHRGAAAAPQRSPTHCGEAGWEGAVFLPLNRRGDNPQRKQFFTRIRGYAKTYPFLHAIDSCSIRPRPGNAVLESLIASQFDGEEWIIREDATHAKSKTYKRAELLARRT